MKYRVSFSGFAYVEADSAAEAEEFAFDGYEIYRECEVTEIEKVDDFIVEV